MGRKGTRQSLSPSARPSPRIRTSVVVVFVAGPPPQCHDFWPIQSLAFCACPILLMDLLWYQLRWLFRSVLLPSGSDYTRESRAGRRRLIYSANSTDLSYMWPCLNRS
ncbi:unnamed protein product [Cylicostephanus goldi]|uniref:Uncharacterized protein n=1 Tax=Cylicostephanus goldi TaxID=71465 RepID=A0A3P7QSM0_CYLGO|nr:unnamed protein product [Cylicostephanus goldi]